MPSARVNDYAGLLSATDRQRLEALLAERERATGAQMVAAIFSSLEGENLEDVSIRLAERWRVGQKGLDNGVILIVFAKDRKVRLEVGYGLEGALPDAVAGQIIRDSIAPAFREGRYAAGLERAVNAVFARIDATPAPERPRRKEPGVGMTPLALLFVVAVIAIMVLSAARRRRGSAPAAYTYSRGGWTPVAVPPIVWGGGGWGRSRGGDPGDGGGFSPGGGSFGGGGASGDW
ncbi:MAG: TPM domain-containing protein [Candidatus Rokuibacteriota bacterium]